MMENEETNKYYVLEYEAFCKNCGQLVETGETYSDGILNSEEKPTPDFEKHIEEAIPPCTLCGSKKNKFDWAVKSWAGPDQSELPF